jgi:hypothetical protein
LWGHLIRPSATFSPSDAEKELFCKLKTQRRCWRTATNAPTLGWMIQIPLGFFSLIAYRDFTVCQPWLTAWLSIPSALPVWARMSAGSGWRGSPVFIHFGATICVEAYLE